MFPSRWLLQQACRITLFTRQNCSLCDTAKLTLLDLQKKRQFEYAEIDVMTAGQEKWKDVYEFDTPVVHIEKATKGLPETSVSARKLMHRFSEDQVIKTMDAAEQDSL